LVEVERGSVVGEQSKGRILRRAERLERRQRRQLRVLRDRQPRGWNGALYDCLTRPDDDCENHGYSGRREERHHSAPPQPTLEPAPARWQALLCDAIAHTRRKMFPEQR